MHIGLKNIRMFFLLVKRSLLRVIIRLCLWTPHLSKLSHLVMVLSKTLRSFIFRYPLNFLFQPMIKVNIGERYRNMTKSLSFSNPAKNNPLSNCKIGSSLNNAIIRCIPRTEKFWKNLAFKYIFGIFIIFSKYDTILVYRQFKKTSISPIITSKLLS